MIYFLIPSYNDSENFELLVKNISKTLKKEKYKVIIIDDGSTDKTIQEIEKLSKNTSLIRIGYKKNHGPGHAFKYGFTYLIPKIKERDIVITMEADNSSDFSILKKMIKLSRKYNVVLSSPLIKGGHFIGLDKNRKVLSEVSRYLDKLIFRVENVSTYASFYRVYQGEILIRSANKYKSKLITEDGFSAVVELLIKLSKLNATMTEVPAVVDWRKRKGKSKMNISKTITRHLLLYKNYLQGNYDHD